MQKNLFFQLIDQYDRYHEKQITNRRFKYEQIVPFIDNLQKHKRFHVKKVGTSFCNQPIYLVEWGKGNHVVLLWTQMHGNEPTATKALLDIWNFLSADDEYNDFRETLFNNLKVYFIPVLNPDGTDLFQRRTSQGIDMNRDALKLQTPEARILKKVRDDVNPEFGFNLHDQSPYYGAGNSTFPAVISFLAPAYNPAKEINSSREKSMQLIGLMNRDLQQLIPDHVGKYDDTFNVRAFGDNIQKWGTSTILIESGGYQNDPDKEYIRKLNFALLLRSFEAISSAEYTRIGLEEYNSIPFNVKENFFDLLIRNAVVEKNGESYKIDIGINREEIDYNSNRSFYIKSIIADMGDLATSNGYEEVDANGRVVTGGKTYQNSFSKNVELSNSDITGLLKNGYTNVIVEEISKVEQFTPGPFNILDKDLYEVPILPDQSANLIILEKREVTQTIVNGFVANYSKSDYGISNGLIYLFGNK